MRWLFIDWVNELIDSIPEIISYIVYGYTYLTAYYWISFKDNTDFKNLIIKSIAASYLLTTIFDSIVKKYNIVFQDEEQKIVVYFLVSAVLGLLIFK